MKILIVAPQPFYQERGTPIAVRLLAETLCEAGHEVDLLVYHEGEDVACPGLRILRIPRPPLARNVPIGLSWKKLVCDVALTAALARLLRSTRYDVVHAVEEALFPAAVLAPRRGAALVYDMDSDLVDSILGRSRLFGWLRPPGDAIQRLALRRARLVLAVCPRLADAARRLAPDTPARVLEDIPLGRCAPDPAEDLRERFGITGPLALYVGNLEAYQGIELLLEAMAHPAAPARASLVLVGGRPEGVERYRARAAALGVEKAVRFAGPRPLDSLGGYLAQADILVSPRVKGENTPMKIYSYLASGKSILATDIGSHTQALDASCALLVPPEPAALAAGLARLAADPALRERLGAAGALLARERFSREAYRAKLAEAYALLGLPGEPGRGAT